MQVATALADATGTLPVAQAFRKQITESVSGCLKLATQSPPPEDEAAVRIRKECSVVCCNHPISVMYRIHLIMVFHTACVQW